MGYDLYRDYFLDEANCDIPLLHKLLSDYDIDNYFHLG